MLNQCVLVGRVMELLPESNLMKIAVSRAYKNENGEYDTDIIAIHIFGGIAKNTCEYCSKGDVVGVKGRLENRDSEMIIVADKISFLSSHRSNEENEDDDYEDDIDNN